VVTLPADELFGPDGTQALGVDEPLGDPLGGLVTGAAFSPFDREVGRRAVEPTDRVVVPRAPAAPDQAPLKAAMDKAMMAGPPTNPLRLPRTNAPQYVRPAPIVSVSRPVPVARPLARRNNQPNVARELAVDPEEQLRAVRRSLAGRDPMRRRHPVASVLVRMIVPIVFLVILVLLVLHGSGSGGNLSNLFG
jgi:hypothetical protein